MIARPLPDPGQGKQREVGLERLVFFSDAVFAIAMTLLVIDLRVPDLIGEVSDQRLSDALSGLWPRVFTYALSFAVIGTYWLAHWRRYAMVRRVDEVLAVLNLVLLGLVAAIPFPTSLLGQFGDHSLAVVIYALVLWAAGLVGTAGWLYAARRQMLGPSVSSEDVRIGALRGLAVPVVMLGSLLVVPCAGPGPAELMWLLILPLHWLIARLVREAGVNTPPAEFD